MRPPTLAATLAFLVAVTVQAQPLMDARVITKKMLPSVVTIKTFNASGEPIAIGSGFVVTAKGLIVTNYHVIDKADAATVKFTNGGEERVEGVVEFDPEKDYAILKVAAIDLPVAPMGNSDKLEQGEALVAIGAPLGLSNTVTTGIVSEIRALDGGRRMIQHTAPISHGSSGGPLINAAGQVIGVNTLMRTDGNSLYFALPINYVRASLASTDGKMVALPKLHEFMAKKEKEDKAAKLQKFLEETFTPYEDADHLFTAMAPRAWQVQRSEKEENATRHVIVMFAPRDAEKAQINGLLSSGIRVHLRLPVQGRRWRADSARSWERTQIEAARTGPSIRKASDPSSGQVGNLSALTMTAVSETKTISKPELSTLYVSATQECLLTVEIVAPTDQEDDLKMVEAVFSKTFKASWGR